MGKFLGTSLAEYDGRRVSILDAKDLLFNGIKLTGKLCCIECGKQVKFVPHEKEGISDYFAHVNADSCPYFTQEYSKEGEIHWLAKNELYRLLSTEKADIFVGNDFIRTIDVSDVYMEKTLSARYADASVCVTPDVIAIVDGIYYCFEIYNKHKVSVNKLASYRKIANELNCELKVIEISVSDLNTSLIERSYNEVSLTLITRFTTQNSYVVEKSLVKLMKLPEYKRAPFGRCFNCTEPLSLCENKESADFSSFTLQSDEVDSVKLVELSALATFDKTELGATLLHCRNCIEGRYFQIHCPKCMRNGIITPMKLLRNKKTGKYFLACTRYETADGEYNTGIKGECDCTLTVFESDGKTLADEILIVKGLVNWLKSQGNSKALVGLRKLKKTT